MHNAEKKILMDFKEHFGSSPGLYNKKKIKLYLKDGTKPITLRPRHIPFALKDKVEREKERLVSLGHLERVESSEWATPTVPVLKSNCQVGSSTRAYANLPHAHMLIPIYEESRTLLTITTHVGLFRYTKLTEDGTSAG